MRMEFYRRTNRESEESLKVKFSRKVTHERTGDVDFTVWGTRL